MEITKYLEKEYPCGVDLVYIDYNDKFDDSQIKEYITEG